MNNNKQPVDEVVVVEVTKDRMMGVISFKPPVDGGKLLTIEQIQKRIKEAGIVSGINEGIIGDIVKQKKYNYKYVIAKGRPSIPGKDGRLEFHFDTQGHKIDSLRPKEKEDGSVDFKDLDLIQTIEKDQLLVELIPPVPGEPGENVLGQEIKPPKGKPVRLPRGKNVYVSSDGLQLFSSIEGQLIYDGMNIAVSETYIVSGNAGIATGNIDFSGNVEIRGDVESGFTIKAGGNVEVKGFVEEATIIAGGDIILRHGIQGKDKGKLIANGNVVTKFIQNSVVESQGSIYAEAIMHSHVIAGDSIIVEVNKGLIVGGSIQATNLISAKIIGSPMSTATFIQISITPSLHKKHENAKLELSQKVQLLDQVEKNIGFIHTKLSQGIALPQNLANRGKQLIELQKKLKAEIPILQKEHQSLEEMLRNYKEGSIKVMDIIYPGTKIVMGSNTKYIKDDIKYCSIYIEDREIKIDTYQ